MIEPSKLGGAILALFLIIFINIDVSAASDAEYISIKTGWDLQDVSRVLQEDIRAHKEVTPLQAENALLHEMRSYSADFNNTGIQFEVFASISAAETGHFRYIHKNNPGGIVNIEGAYKSYESIDDGIQDMYRLLSEEYLSPDGMWYVDNDFTIRGIAKHYNTSIEWLTLYVDVRLSMERRIERCESL